ncbi:hypothetical protein TASCI_10029 [Tenacibaculum ascidiaceicola]
MVFFTFYKPNTLHKQNNINHAFYKKLVLKHLFGCNWTTYIIAYNIFIT